MKTQTPNNQLGFSTVQLLITIAVVAIVSTFAFMGITSARAHIRRMNSARLFASYVERARSDSVRRHAQGAQQASIQQVNTTTYAVTMDFSGSGIVTTQNFSTETGVTISMPRTVTFDWRGRIPVETSVGFTNRVAGDLVSNNVNITGSGDVTLDADVFYDYRLPPVILNGPGGTVIKDPTPTPDPSASPSPTPTPSSSPTPTPSSSPTPTPSSSPTPTPSSSPTPTPSSSPTPAPTPTPVPCSISAGPSPITIPKNTSGTIAVNLNNFSGSGTITATSSNSGQIQVSPASATVTGTSSVTFTITVKKQDSDYVTFSSSCGSQTVTVAVP